MSKFFLIKILVKYANIIVLRSFLTAKRPQKQNLKLFISKYLVRLLRFEVTSKTYGHRFFCLDASNHYVEICLYVVAQALV